MRTRHLFAVLLLLAALLAGAVPITAQRIGWPSSSVRPVRPAPLRPPLPPNMRVYFSPKGGALDAILTELAAAHHTIHVEAYYLTSPDIATALAAAKARGVEVKVIMDVEMETYHNASSSSQGPYLQGAGVDVWTDRAGSGIHHNKVMLVDGAEVMTGSYNYTDAAENDNAENLLLINSIPLAQTYEANFRVRLDKSQRFVWRG